MKRNTSKKKTSKTIVLQVVAQSYNAKTNGVEWEIS